MVEGKKVSLFDEIPFPFGSCPSFPDALNAAIRTDPFCRFHVYSRIAGEASYAFFEALVFTVFCLQIRALCLTGVCLLAGGHLDTEIAR